MDAECREAKPGCSLEAPSGDEDGGEMPAAVSLCCVQIPSLILQRLSLTCSSGLALVEGPHHPTPSSTLPHPLKTPPLDEKREGAEWLEVQSAVVEGKSSIPSTE